VQNGHHVEGFTLVTERSYGRTSGVESRGVPQELGPCGTPSRFVFLPVGAGEPVVDIDAFRGDSHGEQSVALGR
jgi:hypothetical protein